MTEAQSDQTRGVERLPKERAVIELSRQSLVNHFVTRNMDVALAHMADERWRARQRAGTWIVSACCTLFAMSVDGERSMPFEQRATYVWAPTPDGPRIVHLHVSNAADANPLLPSLDSKENAIEFMYEHFDAQGSVAGKIDFRDVGGDLHVLHPNELYTIESEGPRCVVRHAHGAFSMRVALADLESQLPARDFLRLHRGCLVHRDRIVGVEGHRAKLDDGSEYPIAERRYREVKQSLAAAGAQW